MTVVVDSTSPQPTIDSEVGDTTLTRARNVEREVGVRQIFLKFEGGNPTGTQKDRIAFAVCHDALRRGFVLAFLDRIERAQIGRNGGMFQLKRRLKLSLNCSIL